MKGKRDRGKGERGGVRGRERERDLTNDKDNSQRRIEEKKEPEYIRYCLIKISRNPYRIIIRGASTRMINILGP